MRISEIFLLENLSINVCNPGFDINGCPIARGKWKRHPTCPIGRAKWLILNYSVLEIAANFT
jgi:hypothetical protein